MLHLHPSKKNLAHQTLKSNCIYDLTGSLVYHFSFLNLKIIMHFDDGRQLLPSVLLTEFYHVLLFVSVTEILPRHGRQSTWSSCSSETVTTHARCAGTWRSGWSVNTLTNKTYTSNEKGHHFRSTEKLSNKKATREKS